MDPRPARACIVLHLLRKRGTRLLKRYLARHLYRLLQSKEPLMA